MATRKSISKKTRFEVFKRDSFKCQYCGRCAPEVVLVIDHIHPVAKDGPEDVMNYVTSCDPCNAGKGDRTLDDNSVVEKQRRQLEDLQERREQLDMMLQWREGLADIQADQTDAAVDYCNAALRKHAYGYSVTEPGGRVDMGKWVKRFTLQHVLDAIDRSAERHLKPTVDAEQQRENTGEFWTFIPKLADIIKRSEKKPYLQDLYYIRGMLRKRLNFVKEREAMQWMERCMEWGGDVEELREMALDHDRWSRWETEVMEYLAHLKKVAAERGE